MREIKFRAWDNNKMYYQVRCGGVFDGIPTAPTVWNENNGWVNVTGQPYTKVMQYTGLKDKNGKEIYEGDILLGIKGQFKNSPLTVKWNENECYYDLVYKGHSHVKKLTKNNVEKSEVIGNIYKK